MRLMNASGASSAAHTAPADDMTEAATTAPKIWRRFNEREEKEFFMRKL
jgi:hypothetical protein